MFCEKCGSEITEGDEYCPGCGSKIGNANKKNKKLLFGIIAGVIALLIIAVFIIKSAGKTGTGKGKMDEYIGQWTLDCRLISNVTFYCDRPDFISITDKTLQLKGVGTTDEPIVEGDISGVDEDSDGISALHFSAEYKDTYFTEDGQTIDGQVTDDQVINDQVMKDFFDHDMRVICDDKTQHITLQVSLSGKWFDLAEYKKTE